MTPMYEYECLNGHSDEIYLHTWGDKGCQTMICKECNHTMGSIISIPRPLLYFEEGRARTIENLDIGNGPVTVTSHAEHKRAMDAAGVSIAGSKKGTKGSWI